MATESIYPSHPDLTGGGETGLHNHDHNQLVNYSADEHFTKASFMSGVAKITVGTTEPTSPSAGDLWIDCN